MARPLRIEYKDAWYHVMNRGLGRQNVFHSPIYYQAFLQGLQEAYQRFGLEVHGYCLMSNHYHLLVKTPRANLSRCMRHVNGTYTQRHHQLKKTDGPLFRGRYKAILIQADNYLLQVSRYIHRNPIETKQPLVEKLEDYEWSSYPVYCNKSIPQPWLVRDEVLGMLSTSSQRYQQYRRYVDAGNHAEIKDFYAKKAQSPILGSDDFQTKTKDKYQDGASTEVSVKQLKQVIAMQKIVKAVANYYQVTTKSILQSGRISKTGNLPRQVAIYLSQQLSGRTQPDIAKHFNVGHYSTISQAVKRLRDAMDDDEVLRRDVEKMCQVKDLTP